MPRVVHFEVSADDPERAASFYRDVFGWNFHKWDGPEPYWLVTTGPDGTTGDQRRHVHQKRAGRPCEHR